MTNPFTAKMTATLVGQCEMQARDQLDPEFSQFMLALADRLGTQEAALKAARSMLIHMSEQSNYLSLPGTDVRLEFDDHIRQIDAALDAGDAA